MPLRLLTALTRTSDDALREEPREPHVSTDLLAPRVLIQGLTSHFREAEPARSALPPPLPVSHRGVCNLSHVPPETEMRFSFRTATRAVGPVLYSLGEVPRGAAAARPPGAAAVHPPVRGTGPHTPGPRTGCGGPHVWGDASSSLSKGSWVTFCSGLAWGCWGPGLTALPASPTPYLASVCPFVSHVFFAKCKSVCLVCSFFFFFKSIYVI